MDCPNLEFEYGDADGHGAELAGEAGFLGAALLFIGARQAGKMKIPPGWGMDVEWCHPCSSGASGVYY